MSTAVLEEEQAPAGLLHNMSCRPTAHAARSGVHRSQLVRIPVALALGIQRRRRNPIAPGKLVKRLGLTPAEGQQPADALTQWIDRTLDDLGFPPVVAIVPDQTPRAVEWPGDPGQLLAVAIAVATRSTGAVFLRTKSPLWSRLCAPVSVVLALPEDFQWPSPAEAQASDAEHAGGTTPQEQDR